MLEWLLHADDGPRLTAQLDLLDCEGRDVATLANLNGQLAVAEWLRALIDERGDDRRGCDAVSDAACWLTRSKNVFRCDD